MPSESAPAPGEPARAGDGTDAPRSPFAAVRPARRRGLPEEVADQLIDLIAASPSAEVQLPPERRLSEQFGVSRNPLREALAALDQMGVVETRGKARIGFGARARARQMARVSGQAAASTRNVLVDPMEVRRILEPETAALAAERVTPASAADMERWLDLMTDAGRDGRSAVEFDSGFHVAIATATGNAMLIELIGVLTESLQPSRERSFRPAEAWAQALRDHHAILDAIRAGDPRAARRAMAAHLDHVEELIRSTIPASDAG